MRNNGGAWSRLVNAYAGIQYDSPAMKRFNREVLDVIRGCVTFRPENSFLDIGCGKGYFLKHLEECGYKHVQGIEPSRLMISEAIVDNILQGSFENNTFPERSFDIVYTCHTLHHLEDPWPLHAINAMHRIARLYIVIVEINNFNIPMFFRSLLLLNQEGNAFRYNRQRVRKLLIDAGCNVIYNSDLKSSYLSGNSWLYSFMSKMGRPPYNVSIAVPRLK